MSQEANSVIQFFTNNNLVNNADKACLLVNSKGRGQLTMVEDIGGQNVESQESEKLLGLEVSHNLDWKAHVAKLSTELKRRIGILRRLRYKLPTNKIKIVAEAPWNSKLRYGASVYLKPVFEEEELKVEHLPGETRTLQTLQNDMIRAIYGIRREQHVNMRRFREEIKMMSVNQLAVYHTIIETYNIIVKGSSEQLKKKMIPQEEQRYSLRSREKGDLKVPIKPKTNCAGITYFGSKIWNQLPNQMKEAKSYSSSKQNAKG